MKILDALTLAIVAIVFGPFLVVITLIGPLSKLIDAVIGTIGK